MILESQVEKYLIESVLDTLSISANAPTVVVEGQIPFKQKTILNGVLPFSGQMEGYLQFSMDALQAKQVVEGMLGTDVRVKDALVKDGIGEIVSIISGRLKSFLAQKGYSYEIGLPRVITTHGYKYEDVDEEFSRIEKDFICEELVFKVGICYKLIDLEAIEKSMEDAVPEIDAEMLLRQAIEEQMSE